MIAIQKLGKICKEKMITELLLRLEKHPNFIVTNFMGSSTSELESLRGELKQISANYFVVKNSILKIAFGRMKMEDQISSVDGGVGISLSGEDFLSVSRILVKFAKAHDKFKIRGGVIEGKRVAVDRITELASLPPKEVLLSQVIGGIKSPITAFVNVLGGVIRKFVYVVDAIRSNKQDTEGVAQPLRK